MEIALLLVLLSLTYGLMEEEPSKAAFKIQEFIKNQSIRNECTKARDWSCPVEIDIIQMPPNFDPPFLLSLRCNYFIEGLRYQQIWNCVEEKVNVIARIPAYPIQFMYNISQGCACSFLEFFEEGVQKVVT